MMARGLGAQQHLSRAGLAVLKIEGIVANFPPPHIQYLALATTRHQQQANDVRLYLG